MLINSFGKNPGDSGNAKEKLEKKTNKKPQRKQKHFNNIFLNLALAWSVQNNLLVLVLKYMICFELCK